MPDKVIVLVKFRKGEDISDFLNRTYKYGTTRYRKDRCRDAALFIGTVEDAKKLLETATTVTPH